MVTIFAEDWQTEKKKGSSHAEHLNHHLKKRGL
jgi:hypothetical protein